MSFYHVIYIHYFKLLCQYFETITVVKIANQSFVCASQGITSFIDKNYNRKRLFLTTNNLSFMIRSHQQQYLFIYQALLESFTCGITEIDVSKFGAENQKLLRPNQNGTDKNGYQLQFEVIECRCWFVCISNEIFVAIFFLILFKKFHAHSYSKVNVLL